MIKKALKRPFFSTLRTIINIHNIKKTKQTAVNQQNTNQKTKNIIKNSPKRSYVILFIHKQHE